MMRNGKKRIAIRSGRAVPPDGCPAKKIRVVTVRADCIWLGTHDHAGVAWISGRKTIEAIRDALNEVLGTTHPQAGEKK